MEIEQIIKQAEKNIRQAINDYGRYTEQIEVLEDISDEFIHNLARDSSYAKAELRELFSKSPVWDEKIDALVINGTRTHNPDYRYIRDLAYKILCLATSSLHKRTDIEYSDIHKIVDFFADTEQSEEEKQQSITIINMLAPKAYTPTKKLSRVFKSLCVALGVVDENAGSEFQRVYAKFADELNAKKINFKLYISINPAHFLTMSNPKNDERGDTLTSCHSFNSTDYEYNNGCSGYARDEVSFIVFTVADPQNPETLNNRKTTRQIFAYRPGSGLLMQSRMYNTSGGTRGAQEDSKLYRDLVQREISALEDLPNLWKTFLSTGEKSHYIEIGCGFGGYADWIYADFDGHISFRKDCDIELVSPLEVGTHGLCIVCGDEITSGLYCYSCEHNTHTCSSCGEICSTIRRAFDEDGDEIWVCEDCLYDYYTYCDECQEYHRDSTVLYIDGQNVCENCLDEYYEKCENCEEYHRRDNMQLAYDEYGDEIYVCEHCIDNYSCCGICGEYFQVNYMTTAYESDGDEIFVCENCKEDFIKCQHCDKLIEVRDDGICPSCGTIIENKEELS